MQKQMRELPVEWAERGINYPSNIMTANDTITFHNTRLHSVLPVGRNIARGQALKPITGFTLIEVMVVMLIIAIMVGVVGINLQRGDNNRAQDEANRIVILLQAAREEAILQGQVFVVQFTKEGYRFLRVSNKGKLEKITKDDVFEPRTLEDGVKLTFTLEGAEADTEAGLILDPSGSFIPFVLTLRVGEAAWQALGLANGKIQSKPLDLQNAG